MNGVYFSQRPGGWKAGSMIYLSLAISRVNQMKNFGKKTELNLDYKVT